MAKRSIIRIDEGKCNGCGACVPSCAEGALAIVDGKARLVSEVYCDGLGACLGECPQGAIAIEEREAADFDLEAAEKHLAAQKAAPPPAAKVPDLPCGCPGSLSRQISRPSGEAAHRGAAPAELPSQLGNWPVQISLLPVQAPYLRGARLLIAADCVPFAFADFHRRFVSGRTVMVGCPKRDDASAHQAKITEVLRANDIAGIDVVTMEVPCCGGLTRLAQEAVAASGKPIPATYTRIGISGEVLDTREVKPAGCSYSCCG